MYVKFSLFAVLRWWLFQQRETEGSFVFTIHHRHRHKLTSSRAFNSRTSCDSSFDPLSLISLGSLARPFSPRERGCDSDCCSIPCQVSSPVYDWLALIAKFSCKHKQRQPVQCRVQSTLKDINKNIFYINFMLTFTFCHIVMHIC